MKFNSVYFSSGSSKLYNTEIVFNDTNLEFLTEEKKHSYSIIDCKVNLPIANQPVIISLPDGGRLEVDYSDKLILKLENNGLLGKFTPFTFESTTTWFLLALVTFIFIIFILFKYIAPTASDAIAMKIPVSLSMKLDKLFLKQLDDSLFNPTELTSKKRAELKEYFDKKGVKQYNIEFRKGNKVGANAFALAGNTIILTDELIAEITDVRLLLAIVYHEIGHLEKRHVLSSIIHTSFAGLMSLVLVGDLAGSSETLANFAIILYSKKYSRDNESEADLISIQKLKENGLSPLCFIEGLELLVSSQEEGLNIDYSFLSTHPGFDERKNNILNLNKNALPCLAK